MQKHFCKYCIHTGVKVSRYIRKYLVKKIREIDPIGDKKMLLSKKLSSAVAGFSDLKRSFLNVIREIKSFRKSAMKKNKHKMIGLLQVGDTLILKKS